MYSNFDNQKKLTDNNHEENFEDLFTRNLIYELPLFQRDYKWDKGSGWFFYKTNNITPVIETDFSSLDKLDFIYSFFRNAK